MIMLEAVMHVGAVAARLRVYDSGICFVCAHLASGENEGDELKRNYDYSEIVRRGQFPPDSASLDPDTAFSGASETASQVCSGLLYCILLGVPGYGFDCMSLYRGR